MYVNILITGGTGFVGENLTRTLIIKGFHMFIMTRTPELYKNSNQVTYINYKYPINQLQTIYDLIILDRDSLFSYWTKRKKETILTSRVNTTKKVIQMMEQMNTKPAVFINGSAIGYYGTSTDLIFTENTVKSGNDFLAYVV